jgi:chemotaxis response regulator CheB
MCKVLIADDSDIMRTAIRKTLEEESNINIVGEASSFAETRQMIADLKPDVLLLDLHLPENWAFAPALVKAQLGTVCTLATSLSNETEAKALTQSYGAATLLDKMTLYADMVPVIRRYQPKLQNIQQRPWKRRSQVALTLAGRFLLSQKFWLRY